ncbi:uncharacterized protein LOC135962776 [Calliphora vicina]|uniref:uncharacterized protein LOC135962776 n=1 Tax=Calliphora vicina TaxID=7373 RepID=UPI00325AB5D6
MVRKAFEEKKYCSALFICISQTFDKFCARMASTSTKRSRASAEQLSQMVDFMVNNPGLAGGKFKKMHGKLECDKKWAELSETLNCLGGAVKAVNQWQAVWKELKSRTSTKVRDRKRQQALTGNRPLTQEALSDMERRVVAVIGNDYIEGHESVTENIPMEEHFQEDTTKRAEKKTAEDDSETKKQFLEVASKQADALKMLSECCASNVTTNKIMADAIKSMAEGLKQTATAITNLGNVISKILKE